MKRRSFIQQSSLFGGTLLAGTLPFIVRQPPKALGADSPPNILVVLVDQLRSASFAFPSQALIDSAMPNVAKLRSQSVNFTQHYTAATACSPSRACLLTGLYSYQTGNLATIVAGDNPNLYADNPGNPVPLTEPPLHIGVPTWGSALRSVGYDCWYFGKWHLSSAYGYNGNATDLSAYGFDGGTYPSPDGAAGQGSIKDPQIADQFIDWLNSTPTSGSTPWCTTVSLVNPHDIAWYYNYTQCVGQVSPLGYVSQLPPNFETRAQLRLNKPGFQLFFLNGTEEVLGPIPYSGQDYQIGWITMMNLYLALASQVDIQIGRILDNLATSAFANNTIVIFTSDHGEYAGSHGLRGKGGGLYDEGIRIPLMIKDPTGRFSTTPGNRYQLTSSVDIMPLLLTLTNNGSTAWKEGYSYLSTRLDLASILSNPQAVGRNYILSTTDELVPSEVISAPVIENSPSHGIAYRTATAKLGLYSYWDTSQGNINIFSAGQQSELYLFTGSNAKPQNWEVNNVALSQKTLCTQLYASLNNAVNAELFAPLPSTLDSYRQETLYQYIQYAANPSKLSFSTLQLACTV
jgi:arylsulfatase A-like enzyme